MASPRRDELPRFEFGRQSAHINHYYFYTLDPEWGWTFINTMAYAPFPVWVYLTGTSGAKSLGQVCHGALLPFSYTAAVRKTLAQLLCESPAR